jgi:predicted ATPase
MRHLDSIRVEGFKSIRKLELELKPLNVLIGANGAGKSNFISLFHLLNQIVSGRLQSYIGRVGGADALLHFGQKNTNELTLELEFGVNGYKCVLMPSASDAMIFEEEICFYHGRNYSEPYIELLGSGHKESNLKESANAHRVVAYVLSIMKDWRVYHFHDTSRNARVRLASDINDNDRLRPDASNLAAFLYLLKQQFSPHYERIVKTLQMVAPFFDDFILRPSPLNKDKIQLEWLEKDSDAYMNAASLSDGTLRFICLTTLLQQPVEFQPSTIVIDEPELGLHPYAISLLASMIQSAASKKQVIVSTQSVPLVSQFTPEDLIVVDREDGQSVFNRLNEEEVTTWMDEYSLGELWEKNVLGGRPSR